MIMTGQFRNVNDDVITLSITDGNEDIVINIGENGLYFSGEPITIEYEASDLFEHIICTKATINLLTKDYIGDLVFTNKVRGYEVEIKINNQRLFWGYLDANTFNQPYVKGLNEFTLTAVDYLSTLQYYNYKDCNVLNYETQKQEAETVTFKSIIDSMIDSEIIKYYDKSKGITSSRLNTIFNDVSISEILFYGEDFDDVWKQSDVLNEVLKYLNLHAITLGRNIYFFDWESVKNGVTTYRNLNTNANITLKNANTVFASGVFANSDMNITIDDVFSQIQLTCNLESQDTLFENPLDKDSLVPLYSGKQLYCTEYISGGRTSVNDFNDLVKDLSTDSDKSKTVDWMLQVMTNPKWKFYANNNEQIEDLVEKEGNNSINQWKIPYYLKHNYGTPAIVRMGSVEHKGGIIKDNSPISKVDEKDYLYISVNGNNQTYPDENAIQTKSPILEYVGNTSGGILSPSDDTTTNYLVFSGKIMLQPIQWETGKNYVSRGNNFETIKNEGANMNIILINSFVPYYTKKDDSDIICNVVYSDDEDNCRYYTRKFYTMKNPSDTDKPYLATGEPSLQPWSKNETAAGLEYKYSATGDGSDLYSKVPILECELIIGNKRLIETDIDMYGNSVFQWVTVGDEPTATYEDEDGTTKTYTITTFSLGFNPKIDDKIIGTEFPIQNTITYQMNIDAEGTAIPIKKSDNVSGKVQFKIVGLINTTWDEITRRHPSFWRHTKWTTTTIPLLQYTENVIIQDFQCKIYSNNALNDNLNKDNDLVYISNETTDIINKKDDIEFNFVTQLSADECREKGISTTININSVINTTNENTLSSLYDAETHETAKAEEHYLNQYYLEYNQPKMVIETTVHDVSPNFRYLLYRDTFFSPSLNKRFYIIGMNRNLRLQTNTLKLREI